MGRGCALSIDRRPPGIGQVAGPLAIFGTVGDGRRDGVLRYTPTMEANVAESHLRPQRQQSGHPGDCHESADGRRATCPAGAGNHAASISILTSAVQSERQQLVMTQNTRGFLDSYLSVSMTAGALPEQVYTEVLACKGAVWTRQQEMRRMRQDPATTKNPEVAKLYADLERASRAWPTCWGPTPIPVAWTNIAASCNPQATKWNASSGPWPLPARNIEGSGHGRVVRPRTSKRPFPREASWSISWNTPTTDRPSKAQRNGPGNGIWPPLSCDGTTL